MSSRQFFFKLFIAVSLFFSWTSHVEAAMDDYCATPPFLTSAIPPNVLLVIDKSGSMSWPAYYAGWTGSYVNQSYDSSKIYEGYFIPEKKYKLVGGVWQETDEELSCNLQYNTYYVGAGGIYEYWNWFSTYGVCSGNQLNFARMSRIDLLRWAVTGGKPSSCKDGSFTSSDCDPNIECPGDTCTLVTTGNFDASGYWFYDKVTVPTSRINGITQIFEDNQNRPRFGAIFYSNGIEKHKVYIGDYPDGANADQDHPYTYLKRYINAMPPGGGTGSAMAMWEAYDYFKQSNDHNYSNGFDISKNSNDRYKDPLYICDATRGNCSPAPCMKNFVILVSDGQWNYGGYYPQWTCSIGTGYENYSADPVVPAYQMHTDTLRTLNNTDINIYNVYSLGLFLGGTGEQSLKNVAIYGSFDTTNKTWPDSLADYPKDSCVMDDCGYGMGSACTNLPASSIDWDADGDGNPDTFLNAQNAIEIKDALLEFIYNIQKKTSAGSSVSILATKARKGSLINQAVFYPEKRLSNDNVLNWLGYMNAYWFLNTKLVQNIREDTVNATFLDINDDYILDFLLDPTGSLLINAYQSASNGTATDLVTQYSSLDEVSKVWEAGEKLKNTNPDNRHLKYAFSAGDWNEFNATNIGNNVTGVMDALGTSLADYPACLDPLNSGNVTTVQKNLVSYIRGEDFYGCRSRDTGSGTWKLGDIIYSTPKIVDYRDYSLIFSGANDGMLHAFREGKTRTDGLGPGQIVRICDDDNTTCTTTQLGEEVWAFIPKNSMPYLKYLADPNYCHIYFVDLSPYLIIEDTDDDGYIDKRILIGGMRFGGACGCSGCVNPPSDTCSDTSSDNCTGLSSYFALDITDPESPSFLWEFSDPKLAFSYSGPAYIKRGSHRYIMFLNGPTNYNGDAGQDLKVFILTLNSDFTIDTVTKFDGNGDPGFISYNKFASYNNAFGGRLFTEGVDFNEDGDTDMVFFGVNQKTGTTWQGNVIGVLVDDDNATNWDFETVFQSAIEPITAKIEYMKCFDMNYIYFGTGRWFFKQDEMGQNSQDVERLYGIKIDECLNQGLGHCSLNNAHNAQDICNELTRSSSQNVAWVVEDLEPISSEYYKERAITDPTPSNFDVIFFTTTQPSGDLCKFGGRSRIWGLNCATGGAMNTGCDGNFTPEDPGGTLFLQLSQGNIEDLKIPNAFYSSDNRTTEWMMGIPPETATPLNPPAPNETGEIILWFER